MTAPRHDVFDAATRSRVMRAVKGKDTGPEMRVRRALHAAGYRYRLHRRDLPGSPDMMFPRRRAVIFVHGCFWHGHDCPRGRRRPKTNAARWAAKIARNQARDAAAEAALHEAGWRVHFVWECALKDFEAALAAMRAFLNSAPGSHDGPSRS